MSIHANYLTDWGLPGQFTALEVAEGDLDDVGLPWSANIPLKTKKQHEQVRLRLAKKRQPIPACTCGFFGTYRPKRCAAAAAAAADLVPGEVKGGESKGEGGVGRK